MVNLEIIKQFQQSYQVFEFIVMNNKAVFCGALLVSN